VAEFLKISEFSAVLREKRKKEKKNGVAIPSNSFTAKELNSSTK
jgi:hypothetical protein